MNDGHIGKITGNRTRTEQALRASELSYRRLFEAAQDGILILDVDTGRITDANPYLVKLLGFSRGEMIGKTVGELSPFKDIVSNQAMLERLQKDGYVRYEDLPLETRDGRHIAVEFVSNVYQAGDKKVIQCNIRDIRARKSFDGKMRQLSQAVEQSPVLVVITDTKGNIEYVNRKFSEVTGYSLAEVVGKNPRILKSGECPPATYQELWACITSGGTWCGEFHNRKKNGELYWERASISPVLDASGKATHFLAVKEDITERKRAEEALRESEELLKRSQHVARVGHYTLDAVAGDWKTSETLDDIFGIDAAFKRNFAGWSQLLHPEDRDTMFAYLQEHVLKQHNPFDKEYRVVRANDGEHSLGAWNRPAPFQRVGRDLGNVRHDSRHHRTQAGRKGKAPENGHPRSPDQLHH